MGLACEIKFENPRGLWYNRCVIGSTHTYTVYWTDEDLKPLMKAIADLRDDLNYRDKYIGVANRSAMDTRLKMLEYVAVMCMDRAV